MPPLSPLRCLCALLAVMAFAAPTPAHAAGPDVTDEIAASWRTDRVYLYDGLRAAFPPAELARIRAATRTLELPVYIALLPESPYLRQTRSDLTTLLQARIGGDGLFLVWIVDDDYWRGTSELVGKVQPQTGGMSRVQLDDKDDNKIRTDLPAPGIVRTIQQAGRAIDGRPLPQIPAEDLKEQGAAPSDEMSTTDKSDLSAYIGMGIGGLVSFVLVIVLWIRNRSTSRSPARKSARGRPADTPRGKRAPMNVQSVREQASGTVKRAERALHKLESRISSTPAERPGLSRLLDQRDDAARRLEAARLLLAGAGRAPEDGLTAAAGAFVLGRQAQQAAAGGTVDPPCFFNPLHTAGSTQVHWADTDVPACRACVRVLRRDDSPDSFLVWQRSGLFGGDRSAVDYWHLDPEDDPVAGAGFGALGDDLPERIVKQYGGSR